MMNQPLRRVDPLGRSAASTEAHPTAPGALLPMTGSTWPIRGGSVRAIVDKEDGVRDFGDIQCADATKGA